MVLVITCGRIFGGVFCLHTDILLTLYTTQLRPPPHRYCERTKDGVQETKEGGGPTSCYVHFLGEDVREAIERYVK